MRLDGKVGLITGGTSGIGSATAVRFAREGASVALTGRNAERGEVVAQSIVDAGGEAMFIRSDVRIAEDCRQAVEQTLERFGRIDILFNNSERVKPPEDVTPLALYPLTQPPGGPSDTPLHPHPSSSFRVQSALIPPPRF